MRGSSQHDDACVRNLAGAQTFSCKSARGRRIVITLNMETPEYQCIMTNRRIQHNAITMHAEDTMFLPDIDDTVVGTGWQWHRNRRLDLRSFSRLDGARNPDLAGA